MNQSMVTKSKNFGAILSNYKDTPSQSSKSGIYKIKCNKCDCIYIGQTARSFEKRLKEHILATKNKEIHKSSVADHMCSEGHQIDTINSELIRCINDRWKLNAYESLFMEKYKNNLMNNEDSPIISNLFHIVNNT